MIRHPWIFGFWIALLTFSALSQNIYLEDQLDLEVTVSGSFDLISQGPAAQIKEATAELLLLPVASSRQKLIDLNTKGMVEGNQINFIWKNPQLGKQEFGYTAKLQTNNDRIKVQQKINFPLDNVQFEEYTFPSPKIDSDNPAIIRQASDLVEGEDDLFRVVFSLANWVSQNVDYDLNDLTTEVAQPASWVLQNKQGVCDEMTSLFVAMARSLGIPARFVSGVSFTEHQDVIAATGTNWAGHGWAEVYFPDIGWVSFDITFDEFGYVDVTHIKLREGLDPDEPATKYQWLADKVELSSGPLDINVEVVKRGKEIPEAIQMEVEILAKEVKFGSYNLINGVIKNTADYYAATTVQLAVPDQLKIVGNNKRTILLGPKEVRQTSWLVQVDPNLQTEFIYTFPTLLYTEKNITVTETFKAKIDGTLLTKPEVSNLVIQEEDKTYSRKVNFDCQVPREVKVNDNVTIDCGVKNSGNTKLQNLHFCINEKCQTIDLPINQKESTKVVLATSQVGWNKVLVTAKNDAVEKSDLLQYKVLDAPKITLNYQAPEFLTLHEPFALDLTINKKSFAIPQDVIVMLDGLGIQQKWEIEKLLDDQELKTSLDAKKISKTNHFILKVTWSDGKEVFESSQSLVIPGKPRNFSESLTMLFNRIILIFSK